MSSAQTLENWQENRKTHAILRRTANSQSATFCYIPFS